MTQIVVNLESGADSALIRMMIENIRGVRDTLLKRVNSQSNSDTENWIKEMTELSHAFDSSSIDWEDERTRYIMSN